jgi:twitching motility two-component system response regulator PilH
MSLFGQIKSILNNDEQPGQKGQYGRNDRRKRSRFSHKGRKILIVDDSPTIVASLEKLLRSAGCKVLGAADAETGLKIAREDRPDLIFLDIVLPRMSGFAALRQIRRDARTRDIPVIVISGNEQAIEEFYAKRIGADDFMKKPFSRHEVFTRVETLVAKEKLPKLDSPRRNSGSAKPSRSADASEAPAAATDEERVILYARRRLTSMGLQYFSQEQFSAAVERGDELAVKLFINGQGVKLPERPGKTSATGPSASLSAVGEQNGSHS